MFSVLTLVSLLSLVLGFDTYNQPQGRPFISALDLEVIQANLQGAQLVPQLLPTFTPQGAVDPLFHEMLAVAVGDRVNQSDSSTAPILLVQVGPNSTGLSSNTTLFTLIMVDAGPVGMDPSKQRVHWLENGAHLGGVGQPNFNPPIQFITSNATEIVKYVPPAPTPGSGPHRYVILAYLQPSSFTFQGNITDPGNFSLSNYISASGLTTPVLATYFQVENGTTTTTIPTTTSVDTKTLAKASTYVLTLTTSSGTIATVTATGAARREASDAGWILRLTFGCLGVLGTVVGAGLVI